MCFRRQIVWLLAVAGGIFAALPAVSAAEPPTPQAAAGRGEVADHFLRVRRNDDGEPVTLETSIVSYTPIEGENRGVQVDLIGAVHIAERSYYEQLNREFAGYDALLYELVAPEEANIPGERAAEGGNPVSALQVAMKNMLGLEFQLEHIDYRKANFVHADMSPAEFAQSMKDRGESVTQLLFRMMGQAFATQANNGGGASDAQLLLAFFSKDRHLRMKRLMAQQFEDLDSAMHAIEGPDGTTLISQRNQKAFEVLARELAAGKKRIGVFYGAGHLPDMERRLVDQFKMQRGKVRWLEAWTMAERGK